MLNNLIYLRAFYLVVVSGGCEKAIRDLVSPGGLIDLVKNIAAKGFAGVTAELLKPFFEKLLDFAAKVVHPVVATILDILGSDSFSQMLLDFVRKTKAAAQCLDQYDEVWREEAERAGVDVDTLKYVVRQLSGKSEEEIRRRVEELAKSLEEVERQIRVISVSPDATFFHAGEWLAGVEEGGKLKICDVLLHDCERGAYVEYVYNQLDKTVVEKVWKKAAEGGGLIVVRGVKGIGKSTAVHAALYRILQLPLKVGDQYYKPVVVDVEKYSKVKAKRFIRTAKKHGFYPIFYLDPSMPGHYPKGPTGLYQPEMSIKELRSVLDKLRDVTGAVAVVVLSNDQYQAVKDLVSGVEEIDADQLLALRKEEKEEYVEALVKNYSGCPGEVVERVADAIASFDDNYAVAAVLAAHWLKSGGCRVEEVEKAVKEAGGNIHLFALHYLWYGLFNGSGAVASQYVPLLLAVGFFGPHPPKLAKALVRAFGGEPEDIVIRWFSQPLHGTLYGTMQKVAHGAVYRRFGVGSDELCQGSEEGPCLLVEICSEELVGVPPRGYSGVVEVAEEYAKLVARALRAPGPAGVRPIDTLIRDFLRVFNCVAEDGRWRIRYKTKSGRAVEEVVDELDVLSALYGLAVLPGWHPLLKHLEEWFFVNDRRVNVVGLYLHPLSRERGGELVKRAMAIFNEVERRGFYTTVDLLRGVGIAAAGQWDIATDEELEKAIRLAARALRYFATFLPIVLNRIESLLSEAWRRFVSWGASEGGESRQRLADMLTKVAYSAVGGRPPLLPHFFVPEKKEPDPETVARRFGVLYNAASNAGKLRLLNTLLYTVNWDIGGDNVTATLLGNPQLGRRRALKEVAKRVEELVSQLDGVERAYVVARLYPALAKQYTSFGEFDKAVELVEESLTALEELRSAYEKDTATTEKELRSYLELRQVNPDLGRELSELRRYVYYRAVFVYMGIGDLGNATKYATMTCDLAKKLGRVYYEITSCGVLLRLKAVESGTPPAGEFEELWQRAVHAVGQMGAETTANRLGNYVVALTSVNRLGDVVKVLEEWGWALELDPFASALAYGVLSLFSERYLEKVVESLPREAKANLPRLADALHDAVETGLFVKEPNMIELARRKLLEIHGEDVIKALAKVAWTSSKLFLSALVGLAYCKRGEEWGLKLAKAAAWAGSRFKGIGGRLFGEFYKALENASAGKCITDEVLRAVYKLYYRHV